MSPPLYLLPGGDFVFRVAILFVLLSSQIKRIVPSREGTKGWVLKLIIDEEY
jgi:hypothetical protein